MADIQLSASAVLPQQPSLPLLPPDHGRLQGQPQASLSSLYQNHPYHHHQDQEQQLEDMTREFLMQDMTSDPTGASHGPQTFVQLQQQHVGDVEEELNIYDYIHAKQEGEEDDGEDHGHASIHDANSLSNSLVAKDNASATNPFLRQSPVSNASSPAFSAHSPASPSPSLSSISSGMHLDHATADILGSEDGDRLQDSTGIAAIHIKQEALDNTSLLSHPSYMDTSMDLYGSADTSLLPSQSDLMPPPPQDLFRMLMEELQTQAAIQREKFFSATTGSGTGIDSVDFLFTGPPNQVQAHTLAQAQSPTKPVPHFMTETTNNPNAPATGADSGLEQSSGVQGSSYAGPSSEPSPMHVEDLSAPPDVASAPPPVLKSGPALTLGAAMEDVMMETAEPEDDLPPSPTHSSSSSGSVTPELTSPSLYPANATVSSSLAPCSSVSRSSPRSEVARVAFNRIAHQHPKQGCDSKNSVTQASKESNFQSAMSHHGSRRRSAEAWREESSNASVITILPISAKKRKLSHEEDNRRASVSPRLNSLPSPPSSVRTTPPLQPLAVDMPSSVESLELPPSRINSVSAAQPVTPTSPSPCHDATKLEPVTPYDSTVMESADTASDCSEIGSAVDSPISESTLGKKTNANNKRPWTTEEEKLLLKLVDNMTPIKDIAETLNRSVHSVRSRRQVLTDPGFVKGNGHAQPRRSKPDPSSKLPTYSQMAFLSLARLPELQGTLNDVASMVEKLFSRHLNRIPRTGHKNLQIWRAQISDALAHEKGHPRPRFESFGLKRGRQWVYRLTDFGKGVMEAMGGVDQICDDLLKNNEMAGAGCGPDGESTGAGGAGAGLGQGEGYGYSYCPDAIHKTEPVSPSPPKASSGRKSSTSSSSDRESREETSADSLAASNAIANAMAAMAAGLAAMTAVEDEKSAAAAASGEGATMSRPTTTATTIPVLKSEPLETLALDSHAKGKTGKGKQRSGSLGDSKTSSSTVPTTTRAGRRQKA
ncbi:hypothetical protein EDD21DRAFT_413912 [Dissophora ornata]|nr:hypothetical protein BGZ58_010470 [Dissophora ornata]KAI8602516.1 hypothetical protein EDD21DRAFT_413912 [Dissophora ornata]